MQDNHIWFVRSLDKLLMYHIVSESSSRSETLFQLRSGPNKYVLMRLWRRLCGYWICGGQLRQSNIPRDIIEWNHLVYVICNSGSYRVSAAVQDYLSFYQGILILLQIAGVGDQQSQILGLQAPSKQQDTCIDLLSPSHVACQSEHTNQSMPRTRQNPRHGRSLRRSAGT